MSEDKLELPKRQTLMILASLCGGERNTVQLRNAYWRETGSLTSTNGFVHALTSLVKKEYINRVGSRSDCGE